MMRLPYLPCLAVLGNVILAQDSISYDFDAYDAADDNGSPYQTFVSNENVKPPVIHVNSNSSGMADGYIFLGVNEKPSSEQNWPTIFEFTEDRMGSMVWTADYPEPFDFKAQTYKGEPVLTFWSGEHGSWGRGSFYVLNQSYVEIAHFQVARYGDDMGDIHEFVITENDTALVAVYHEIQLDLSSEGGASDGWVLEGTFQELDIEKGGLVFEWNASSHVGLNETYDFGGPMENSEDDAWDWFHMNSIEKDQNGDYIVSARVMNCIYKISGQDGHIVWRLGGKQSDFEFAETSAQFAYQHDARWLNEEQTRMSLWDNADPFPEDDSTPYSRGIILELDYDNMRASLVQEFMNEERTFAQYEGSAQVIDPSSETSNVILGYGSQPFFTELDYEGNILLDVQFATDGDKVRCYRTFRLPWQGKPLTNPDIAWNGSNVYVSWNGATDVETWEVYTSNETSSDWNNVTLAKRTGFETTIDLSDMDLLTYVRAKAVDSAGDTLGWTMATDGTEVFDAIGSVDDDDDSPNKSAGESGEGSGSGADSDSSNNTANAASDAFGRSGARCFAAAVVFLSIQYVF